VIVVLDNYDSFTFNLVQALGARGREVEVRRNDRTSLAEIESLAPSHVVISPGPGRPEDAGLSMELLRAFSRRVPILGVCLGHQALGAVAGGKVVRAERPMHGRSSPIYHDGRGLFRGLPNPFEAGRYHSLVVAEEGLPQKLEVAAHTADGEIMALRWRGTLAVGVQFHPESILTPKGGVVLDNFLEAPARPC
jgi:anthranilate synthase/aminodeoxychorismate synthase-like glutamine amidotransferase